MLREVRVCLHWQDARDWRAPSSREHRAGHAELAGLLLLLLVVLLLLVLLLHGVLLLLLVQRQQLRAQPLAVLEQLPVVRAQLLVLRTELRRLLLLRRQRALHRVEPLLVLLG